MQKCLVPVRIGECRIHALVDSGSSVSAINSKLFNRSKLQHLPIQSPSISKITGAGGAQHPVSGQINIEFRIGGVTISHKFLLIPALQNLMILGTDFLSKNKARLDWESNTLSLLDRTIAINAIKISPGLARVQKNTLINHRNNNSQKVLNQNRSKCKAWFPMGRASLHRL